MNGADLIGLIEKSLLQLVSYSDLQEPPLYVPHHPYQGLYLFNLFWCKKKKNEKEGTGNIFFACNLNLYWQGMKKI